MILCVDIGNTATKVTLVGGDAVVDGCRLPTGDTRALSRAASDMLGSHGPARGVGVSTVVPDITPQSVRDALSSLGKPIVAVSHLTRLPFRMAVAQPERVGADRLCAASGAVGTEAPDAVVVDIGTAITVDRVRDLQFVGGAIMPGPAMMLRAMGTFTAQLPQVDLDGIETLFPATPAPTENAMALGVGVATLGGILEGVRRMGEPSVPVWVTGGGVGPVVDQLPRDWIRDPDLSARGLYRIARLNLDLREAD